jgi:hypothetical protein
MRADRPLMSREHLSYPPRVTSTGTEPGHSPRDYSLVLAAPCWPRIRLPNHTRSTDVN